MLGMPFLFAGVEPVPLHRIVAVGGFLLTLNATTLSRGQRIEGCFCGGESLALEARHALEPHN